MPGRLLDVFNRASRSESFKSQHSDGSSTGKGAKKVSFDKKLKGKQFKPRKKKKQRPAAAAAAAAPLPPRRDGSNVVAYLQTNPTSGASSERSAATPGGGSWFKARQPVKHESKVPKERSRFFLSETTPPVPRAKMNSSASYNYDLDPSLHPSQQPSQVPRVQRNLVKSIVAQFNEEAKKREISRQTSLDADLSDERPVASPILIEATPENAPNRREPFSYTAGTATPPPLGPRSKSDYNIQVPADLIYAQVVVNGQGSGKSDGKHKTTIHTKVPNRSAMKTSATFVDSKKHFSKSTGNLHAGDPEDCRVLNYHLRNNNKTDNSYYKFDPVDEEAPVRTSPGKSKDAPANGHRQHQSNGKLHLRSNSVGMESEGDDPAFGPSRHRLIQLQDTKGLLNKGGPGDYETRNVEKWSENEVGPHSKKFTEHEYVHEVSMSNNNARDAARNKNLANKLAPIYGTPLKSGGHLRETTTQENFRDKSREWSYNTEQNSNSLLREKKSRHRARDTPGAPEDHRRAKSPASPEWRSLRLNSSKENVAASMNTERLAKPTAQYYFGEQETLKSPRDSPRPERVPETDDQKNGWKTVAGFKSTTDFRRNSSDSGSGVGLLSSKLVKKANAEVNGYVNDGLYDSADDLEGRNYQRNDDGKFQNGNFRLGSSDKLSSPTWLSRRSPDNRLDSYDDVFQDVAIPAGHTGGYTTEQRRIFRKDEKKHVTKHETRTTRRPPSADRDETTLERSERRRARKAREESANGSLERQPRQRMPTSSRKEDEAYWSHSAKTTSSSKPSPDLHRQATGRKVDIEIDEKRSNQRHHSHTLHSSSAFGDEFEDKMETSESEPQLYGGSQDSHMSLGSRLSSAEEEECLNQNERIATENIIAAHVNTPQSMVKQMNKRQISYENAQHRQEARDTDTTRRRLWFEREGTDEVDDARRSQSYLDRTDANSNPCLAPQNNNHQWTSATMSRLETNKNRRNNRNDEHHLAVSTVDRRDMRRRRGDDIRIQLNDRDISRDAVTNGKSVGRSSSFNSRVGSYHSGDESLHSAGSSTSNKKRVNFKKTNGRSHGGYGSRSDLSPMHREALMRSASPARAPSTTGSLKSNDSEASHASNKSIILHATAVADIPPARGYRYRSANTSPSPPSVASSSGGRESRTVQRSFSLLSPWKPRKYKDKYDRKENPKLSNHEFENGRRRSYHEEQQLQLSKQQQQKSSRSQEGGGTLSHSSSEKLDSLSPLASESPPAKSKGKKKNGILRRHSMPKDSRFANFFRRKKDAKS